MDFFINPINRCVVNKMINGKKYTIFWYDYDNKILHAEPTVIKDILEQYNTRFCDIVLTISQNILSLE